MSDSMHDHLSALFVIFGSTGDLTNRKLMPAFYNLVLERLLPEHFAIVCIGRRNITEKEYKKGIYASIKKFSRNKVEDDVWDMMQRKVHYYPFDFTNSEGFGGLKDELDRLDGIIGTQGNRVFYMAVAPEYFETIVQGLQYGKMASNPDKWSCLIIEKPFGKDLLTANKLNNKILEVFLERDIYRIDHYLGKEMIQNIMVLRFCNSIFESIWNNRFIDNIQITLDEELGVGARAGYYEQAGAIRDMIQNHMIQILSLVAMEPPTNLHTDSIRTEKKKVLEAIEEITPEFLRDQVVFGQYGPGVIEGRTVAGYRGEMNVPLDSSTETFVALKLHIDNFRWSGIPFYIRTGKRLRQSSSNIVIQFKEMPPNLYFKDQDVQEPNLLVIRIQPNIGVYFQFNTKDFSSHNGIVTTKMDTCSFSPNQGNTPEAYERLIHDILRGDSTLFPRWDEVEAAWAFADNLIHHREQTKDTLSIYDAGSMGPVQAFELLAREGHQWWQV